jgi:hypothetical protein
MQIEIENSYYARCMSLSREILIIFFLIVLLGFSLCGLLRHLLVKRRLIGMGTIFINKAARYNLFSLAGWLNGLALALAVIFIGYFLLAGYARAAAMILCVVLTSLIYHSSLRIIIAEKGIIFEKRVIAWQEIVQVKIIRQRMFYYLCLHTLGEAKHFLNRVPEKYIGDLKNILSSMDAGIRQPKSGE